MAITHSAFSFFGGDDWFINAQLTDQDDKPYDLDALDEIKWLLHSPRGEIVPHEFLIRKIDAPNGKLNVWLPADTTTRFPSGVYYDFLRIVCDGITSTLLTGPINVTADPWRAPVAEMERVAGRSSADVVVVLSRRERIERRPAANDDKRVRPLVNASFP
jgi:hypothetical protein